MTRSCNWSVLEKQYKESRSTSDQGSLYSDLNKIHVIIFTIVNVCSLLFYFNLNNVHTQTHQERRANFPFNFPINTKIGNSKIQFISEFDPGECYPHYDDSATIERFDAFINEPTFEESNDEFKSTLIRPKEFTTTEKQHWLTRGKNFFKKSPKIDRDREHVIEIAKYVFDELTHLQQYPSPTDTSCVIAVVAEKDAYIPRNNVTSLEDIWPGQQLKLTLLIPQNNDILTSLALQYFSYFNLHCRL